MYPQSGPICPARPRELQHFASQLRIVVGDARGGHIGNLLREGISRFSGQGDGVGHVVVDKICSSCGGETQEGNLNGAGFMRHEVDARVESVSIQIDKQLDATYGNLRSSVLCT